MSLRFAPVAFMSTLSLLWVMSLPIWPLRGLALATQQSTHKAQTSQIAIPPSGVAHLRFQPLASTGNWRDALVVHLSMTDSAIQLQRGQVLWKAGPRVGQYPITVIADGDIHAAIIPLGMSSDWPQINGADAIDLQLVFPFANQLDIHIEQATLFRRLPFAWDAALGRALAPILPMAPEQGAMALLTGALLGLLWVALIPTPLRTRFPRRQVMAGVLVTLCAIPNAIGVVEELQRLPQLWQHYSGLSEPALGARLPHYNASPSLYALLGEAASQLPSGRVLVIPASPADITVKARAHAALFPRVVVFAAALRSANLAGVSGIIQPARGLPPKQGWQRMDSAFVDSGYEVWRAHNAPSASPLPLVGFEAWPRFALGVALVLLAGFMVIGQLGWRGWARIAGSLPMGMGIVTAWMFVLSLLHVPWSAQNIGVLLMLIGGGLGLATLLRLKKRTVLQQLTHLLRSIHQTMAWTWLAALVIVGLTLAVSIHAALIPFADQDTWTTWGFNGRAFFLSGDIASALTHYAEGGLNHPSYPPAFPLLQAWGFYSIDGINERLIKLMMPLWYLSLIVLVWGACRRWVGPRVAAMCAVWLATTPLLLDHATLGNADLPFTTLMVAAAIGLMRWLELRQMRWLLSGAILLGIAAFTKLDGFYLGLLMLTAAIILVLIPIMRSARKLDLSRIIWPLLRSILIDLGAMLLLYFAWLLFTHQLQIKGETPSLSLLAVNGLSNFAHGWVEALSEMALSHTNSTWGLLGGGYGLLWVAGLSVLLIDWRKLQHDTVLRFLTITMLGTVLFYVLIYTLRPFFSMERYLMHAAPLLILAVARTRIETHQDQIQNQTVTI